jgi:hypothetical protein
MRKQTLLLILFFGSLWGAVEAILGGVLYRAEVPRAAVPLGILALLILSVSRVYCPAPGCSTLIAACAMLLKFTNTPFFACHLLGILLLGAAHDLVLLAGGKPGLTALGRTAKNALIGAATSYLGFALFAVSITYVFRYQYWAEAGLPRVLDHVFVAGSLTAAGGAIAAPLGAWIGELLKARQFAPFELRSWLTTGSVSVLTMVLWIVAATVSF